MKLPNGLLQAGLSLSIGNQTTRGVPLREGAGAQPGGLPQGFGGFGEGGQGPVVQGGGGPLGGAVSDGPVALGGAQQGGDPALQGAIAEVLKMLQKQGKLDLSGAGDGGDDAGMQAPQLQMPQAQSPQTQSPQTQSTQGATAASLIGGPALGALADAKSGPTPEGAPEGAPPDANSTNMPMPSADDKRPEGDTRGAQEIIDGDPNLKNLGNQGDTKGDANPDGGGLRDGLKKQCGDFEHDPDAAYRASKVLAYIKTCNDREGGVRSDDQIHNGKIDGITNDGDARHGTEAGMLQDFGKNGYSALPANHQLDQTNDSHVKLNGTNKDNFQWACGEAAKGFAWLPLVGNTLKGIGDSDGGFGGALLGGLKAGGKTILDGIEGAIDAIKKGKVNPFSLLLGAYKGELKGSDQTPDVVKSVLDKLPI